MAVYKMDPKTGQEVPNEVASRSPVYTGWKRVFVEKDRMFRRGNLLDPLAHGGQFTPDGNSDPDVLYLYRWDSITPKEDAALYVQPGDTVVLFDTGTPYPEGPFETAVVVSTEFADVPKNPTQCFPPNCGEMPCECVSVLNATLDRDLAGSYQASPLDFVSGRAAAVGVISGCDASTNQINGPGSCFFDADLRDVEEPFRDAYVEVLGRREGSGAVPYLSTAVPFYDSGLPGGQESTNRASFKDLWWATSAGGLNRFYLLGCRGKDFTPPGTTAGITDASNDFSFVYTETMMTWGQYEGLTEEEILRGIQGNTDHELAHQFWLNRCTNLTCGSVGNLGNHDGRPWWGYSTSGCPNDHPCLMDPHGGDLFDGTNRFCREDLLSGDPNCSATVRANSAIRTLADPVP